MGIDGRKALTYENAENIRSAYATGIFRRADLAIIYDVSIPTIQRILSKRTYAMPDESIWDRLLKQTVIQDTCFIWTGGVDSAGYGEIRYNSEACRIPRMVYQLSTMNDIGQWHVLHSCDIRRCWNPSHLFYGTNLDNIRDKTRKQRNEHSENHHAAKLSNIDVIAIRKRFERGNRVLLASEYGVSIDTISNIVSRRTWRYV